MTGRAFFKGEMQLVGWRESHNGGAVVNFRLVDPASLDAFRKLTVGKGKLPGQSLVASMMVKDAGGGSGTGDPARVKGGQLSRLAGILCAQPRFHSFVMEEFGEDVRAENECTDFLRKTCGVTSRAELDHNSDAARVFHERFRRPFAEFNEKK